MQDGCVRKRVFIFDTNQIRLEKMILAVISVTNKICHLLVLCRFAALPVDPARRAAEKRRSVNKWLAVVDSATDIV
jgi:Rps23 Pro-64 3,4-dihydroxylase Tpa1-like proline 4-hydroxylase